MKCKIAVIGGGSAYVAGILRTLVERADEMAGSTLVLQDIRPERQQVMLEAVADYASISLVNARLFQALEDRAQQLEREIEKSSQEIRIPDAWLEEINRSIRAAQAEVRVLIERGRGGKFRRELETVRKDLDSVLRKLADMVPNDSSS